MPPENSTNMYVYRTDEQLLANATLLVYIAGIFLYIFDKEHFEIFFTNPLLYFLFGLLLCLTGRAYVSSNHMSYFLIEGIPAKKMGVSIMIFSLVSALLLNSQDLIPQFSIKDIMLGQLVFYAAILIGFSLVYGEKLIRRGLLDS